MKKRNGLPLRARLLLLLGPPFVAVAALSAVAILAHGQANDEVDRARQLLRDPGVTLEQQERSSHLAQQYLRRSADGNRRVQLAVAGGLACSLGLAVAAAALLNGRFVRPIRAAQRTVRRVSAGDTGVRMATSPDGELAELADTINALAADLDKSRRTLMFTAVVESSPDLIVIIDEDGVILHASPAATAMLGRPAPWLAGHPLAGFVHPDDRVAVEEILGLGGAPELLTQGSGGRVGAGRWGPLPTGPTADPASTETWNVRLSHVQGRWLETEVTAADLRHDPSVRGTVLHMRDLAERRADEEELRHLALHDPLTRLANRSLFREHVEHALARTRRTPARPHAVLFVDLDGFKTINDSLGHAAGDEVLVELAERVRTRVRPGDTASRLGGDEFAILLENSSESDAVLIAKRILDALSGPIVVHGKDVVITGSLGIALSEPGQHAEELMRNADVAMYRAKAAGKSQYQTFRPEMQRAALARLDLEADLRRAVDQEELVLHYQPIVALDTGAPLGMEVLVRWRHPERGLVYPGDFIGAAEESGLILPMGRWILREACRQQGLWNRKFGRWPLMLSVNVSARQIEDPGFFDDVVASLEGSGVNPDNLVLEITESLLMSDVDAAIRRLTRLKDLGVQLAIDDFGTGYSSLSYLRSMPIDILKIDKAFVDGVTRGPEQSAVAQAVIKLAHTFGLRTVAEGIEEPGQVTRLAEMRGDMGQGYYFAPPLTADAVGAYLRRKPRGPSGPAEREARGPSGPAEREARGPSGPAEREARGPSGPAEREAQPLP